VGSMSALLWAGKKNELVPWMYGLGWGPLLGGLVTILAKNISRLVPRFRALTAGHLPLSI
jgi:hypothetical protein